MHTHMYVHNASQFSKEYSYGVAVVSTCEIGARRLGHRCCINHTCTYLYVHICTCTYVTVHIPICLYTCRSTW